MNCAAVALAAVGAQHGLAVRVQLDGEDASLSELTSAAREAGLDARPVHSADRDVAGLPLPAILHVDGDHWLALLALGGGEATVADARDARTTVPVDEIARRWSGYALVTGVP